MSFPEKEQPQSVQRRSQPLYSQPSYSSPIGSTPYYEMSSYSHNVSNPGALHQSLPPQAYRTMPAQVPPQPAPFVSGLLTAQQIQPGQLSAQPFQSGHKAVQKPRTPPMPKPRALALANRFKRWFLVASVLGFGGVSALVVSNMHITSSTSTTSSSNSSSSTSSSSTSSSSSSTQTGGYGFGQSTSSGGSVSSSQSS
jgi:hypothetical protein